MIICQSACFSSYLSWQQTAQVCEGSFESWPGKINLNAPIQLGSTQFLRFLLLSTLSITTAYLDDLFMYLSPSVTFFILFPHLLVWALKFPCHRNGCWHVLTLAFTHCSDEEMEQASVTEHSCHLIINSQTFYSFDAFYNNISYWHQTPQRHCSWS